MSKNHAKFSSVATMDHRGQLVINKETRKEAKIEGGEKFAVFTAPSNSPGSSKLVLVKLGDVIDQTQVAKFAG
ncbi:MAG: AbrB/MazE/SpoVT family DNA-binding domain-containing protein [Ignavibacteriae bacterium]|nr:AbrB/MazE/SpoVT family DNA-binding domain-containing protein [Ignavibacteriota bacterium]MCB9242517.1 AbrB/MazE/SpoVT family DNA-binding domain-containing protein [Ignavibacteriales bacterium]